MAPLYRLIAQHYLSYTLGVCENLLGCENVQTIFVITMNVILRRANLAKMKNETKAYLDTTYRLCSVSLSTVVYGVTQNILKRTAKH